MSTYPESHFTVRILRLLEQHGSVTFGPIMDIEGAHGPCALRMDGNIVLWAGMSDQLVEAIHGLFARDVVRLKSTTVLDYAASGGGLKLPLVRSADAAARGYAEPHWHPVLIEPGAAWDAREL